MLAHQEDAERLARQIEEAQLRHDLGLPVDAEHVLAVAAQLARRLERVIDNTDREVELAEDARDAAQSMVDDLRHRCVELEKEVDRERAENQRLAAQVAELQELQASSRQATTKTKRRATT